MERRYADLSYYNFSRPAPFGYVRVRNSRGRWGLALDESEYGAPIARRIIDEVLDGRTYTEICERLNADRVPTASDARRLSAGLPSRNLRWTQSTLHYLLRSEWLVPWAVVTNSRFIKGKPRGKVTWLAVDRDNKPQVWCEGIIDQPTLERLNYVLNRRLESPALRRRDRAMLLYVLSCECGLPAVTTGTKERSYYRCRSVSNVTGEACGYTVSIRVDEADTAVETAFLDVLGDTRMGNSAATYRQAWVEADRAERNTILHEAGITAEWYDDDLGEELSVALVNDGDDAVRVTTGRVSVRIPLRAAVLEQAS